MSSLPYYKYWVNRRNNEDQVYEDTSQVRNVLLRYLYGIKRLNRTDKKEFPHIFFFHEKGKTKLQYHTHLLIPKKNLNPDYDNETDLSWLYNDKNLVMESFDFNLDKPLFEISLLLF